jgi:hypothetical protein
MTMLKVHTSNNLVLSIILEEFMEIRVQTSSITIHYAAHVIEVSCILGILFTYCTVRAIAYILPGRSGLDVRSTIIEIVAAYVSQISVESKHAGEGALM